MMSSAHTPAHTPASLQPDPSRFTRPFRLRSTRPRASSSETQSSQSSSLSSSKAAPLGVEDPSRLRSRSSPRLPGSPLRHAASFDEDGLDTSRSQGPESEASAAASTPSLPRSRPMTFHFADKPAHRHASELHQALGVLASFASQQISIHEGSVSSLKSFSDGEVGLEREGWVYAGTRQGVRIYSRDIAPDEATRSPLPSPAKGKQRADGVVEDTSLPYFRGESWLPGSWRPSDIAATFRSIPARAAFEPGLDSSKSKMVQILDEATGDALVWHRHRGIFPVGDRDSCLVDGYREIPADPDTGQALQGFIISTSVEDPLAPETLGILRLWTYLRGLAIKPMRTPPVYDTPENQPHAALQSAFDKRRFGSVGGVGLVPPQPRARPLCDSLGHSLPTSTRSHLAAPSPSPRISWSEWDWTTGAGGAAAGKPAIQVGRRPQSMLVGSRRNTPAEWTRPSSGTWAGPTDGLSKRASDGRRGISQSAMSSSVLPALPSRPQSPLDTPLNGEAKDDPGCHLSFIVRVDPMVKLPVTLVNQISLKSPLVISNLARFMTRHGFAPHLCRETSAAGVHVIGEEFDVASSYYKIQYSLRPHALGGCTRIRFHGLTFGRGQFEIDVLRAPEWRIEYDTPDCDASSEDQPPLEMRQLPPDTKNKRFSIRMTPAEVPRAASNGKGARANPAGASLMPPAKDEDLALLPGPRGGCTLVVENTTVGPTIQVQIRRSSEKSAPLDAVRRAMDSLDAVADESGQMLSGPSSIEDSTERGKAWLSASAGKKRRDSALPKRENVPSGAGEGEGGPGRAAAVGPSPASSVDNRPQSARRPVAVSGAPPGGHSSGSPTGGGLRYPTVKPLAR